MFQVVKTYGHERGLSACFRQHKATSHCALLHGYALAFTFHFQAAQLDERNWVVDFGDLNKLEKQLKETFDHKLLVATDDPDLPLLRRLAIAGVAQLIVCDAVGCEAFAKMGYEIAVEHVVKPLNMTIRRRGNPLVLIRVDVAEHGANTASYIHKQVEY